MVFPYGFSLWFLLLYVYIRLLRMKHEEKTGDDFAFGEERILEHLFGGFTLCNSRGIIRIHKGMMNVAGFDDDDDGSGFGGQATCVWLKRGVFGFV